MIKVLNLKVNDLQPIYRAKAIGVDLTGATIVCTMKSRTGAGIKINRQSAGITIDPDQVTNEGLFTYQWQAGDTDTIDHYNIEFEITPATGGKFTIPNNDIDTPAIVKINTSLDTI